MANYDEWYSKLIDDETMSELSSIASASGRKKKFFDEEPDTFFTDYELEKKQEEVNEIKGINGIPRKHEPEDFIEFKRYTKRHEHKYTKKEMEAIRKGCEDTIVHDYSENDFYHISDEERARLDSLIELRVEIGKLRRTYNRVDEYVKAMRTVVKAWELLEKRENYLHDEDEFFRLVAEGRIYNSSIIMPKLRKAEKYNMELIIRYICNPELDPSDLVENKYNSYEDDDWYDDESMEDKMKRLLSPEEVIYLTEHDEDNIEGLRVKDAKKKWIKGYDKKGHISFSSKKKNKNKKEKYTEASVHDLLQKIQNRVAYDKSDMYTHSWFVTTSLFDTPKEPESAYDKVRFEGSWTSKDDLFLYDLALQEAIANEHPVGERYTTNSDKQLSMFFKTLEDEGVNVVELRRRMNMSDSDLQKSDIKKEKANNKKKEAAIMQRIQKLNGNAKFKKLVAKAEKAINDSNEYL